MRLIIEFPCGYMLLYEAGVWDKPKEEINFSSDSCPLHGKNCKR